MATLQPVMELNEEIRRKATASILVLEEQGELGDSTLVWNNLFFRHPDGAYYATFHDIAYDNGYPDWLRSDRGVIEIKLWWVDGEILATPGDVEEAEFIVLDSLTDSGNRRWMLTGPQTVEPASPPPPPAPRPAVPHQPALAASPSSSQASKATQPAQPPRGPTEVSLRPGQRVRHATFGEGTVESSRHVDRDEEVVIAFADRTRRLLLSFAKLQLID